MHSLVQLGGHSGNISLGQKQEEADQERLQQTAERPLDDCSGSRDQNTDHLAGLGHVKGFVQWQRWIQQGSHYVLVYGGCCGFQGWFGAGSCADGSAEHQ
jgi:hypothetical protein